MAKMIKGLESGDGVRGLEARRRRTYRNSEERSIC
jgi:hypothetical protein